MPKDKALELECPHCDAAYSLETVQTHEDVPLRPGEVRQRVYLPRAVTVRAVCRCCAKEVVIKNGRIVSDARDVTVSDDD
jgi:hypothetical protein